MARGTKHICVCKKCKKDFIAINNKRKYCVCCRPPNLFLSEKECHDVAILCKTRWEFQQKYYRYYRQSFNKGWLDKICKHMPNIKYVYTKDDCLEKAKLCKSKSEFGKLYKVYYNSSLRNNWLEEICSHMDNIQPNGFTKTAFINNCKTKNNNLGIFYLLKCVGNNESFYKIGITSTSVKVRYSNGSDMKYKWNIIWEIEDAPEIIWDLEVFYKKQIKNIIYIPKLWKCKTTTECFKCHGNCNILKRENKFVSLTHGRKIL